MNYRRRPSLGHRDHQGGPGSQDGLGVQAEEEADVGFAGSFQRHVGASVAGYDALSQSQRIEDFGEASPDAHDALGAADFHLLAGGIAHAVRLGQA
ncbi:hypothetical protein [Allomeiothermus silvanus]|uniref:hypothetical protein n=1 Tax=Allomeiothermus silvanus TaxID=52022 RepID=UPI0030B834B4